MGDTDYCQMFRGCQKSWPPAGVGWGWIIYAFTLLSFFIPVTSCQESHYKFMFYNVENLFDTVDDSLTADNDFTPSGRLHWTSHRYSDKLNKISKVIIAAGGWEPPAIIGLCEIENRIVLNDLIYNTPLSKFPYKIIHKDSPDERGIDVALLYDSRIVAIAAHSVLPVSQEKLITRDILYAKAVIRDDTCHIFINHWPSRSSGQLETEPYRFFAAGILRNAVDSLLLINPKAKILITGDFNDDPGDESLTNELAAFPVDAAVGTGELYNLSVEPLKGNVRGTLKYQGSWNIFDQVIVSGAFLNGDGLKIPENSYRIFYNTFMLEPDITFNGVKPFRTYLGFRYQGGFSDHLPVTVDIY